jgi:hypothetical protein
MSPKVIHPVEDGPLRISGTIDSRHGGKKAPRNEPTSRLRPCLPLKRREEPQFGRGNQVEKTSTGVDARPGDWKLRGTINDKGCRKCRQDKLPVLQRVPMAMHGTILSGSRSGDRSKTGRCTTTHIGHGLLNNKQSISLSCPLLRGMEGGSFTPSKPSGAWSLSPKKQRKIPRNQRAKASSKQQP